MKKKTAPTLLDLFRATRRCWGINPRTRVKAGKKGGHYRRTEEKRRSLRDQLR